MEGVHRMKAPAHHRPLAVSAKLAMMKGSAVDRAQAHTAATASAANSGNTGPRSPTLLRAGGIMDPTVQKKSAGPAPNPAHFCHPKI